MQTFFQPSDYEIYLSLLAERASESNVRIWGHALMPNHIHLIAVPDTEGGLRRAIGETHRCYTNIINQREGWTGYLWQGRFSSCPMDDKHCLNAARYIELNPVRAGLVAQPEFYPWSSARAHLNAQNDRVVEVRPLLDMAGDWKRFLADHIDAETVKRIRDCQRTGRPLGSDEFIADLEVRTGRILRRQRTGPKPAGGELGIVSPN
jgi:putative transposase